MVLLSASVSRADLFCLSLMAMITASALLDFCLPLSAANFLNKGLAGLSGSGLAILTMTGLWTLGKPFLCRGLDNPPSLSQLTDGSRPTEEVTMSGWWVG